MTVSRDPDQIPDTLEEAEIFMGTNIKTDAEIAAQVAASMTLNWNEFNDTTFRRCVEDLTLLRHGCCQKRQRPQLRNSLNYVDPIDFVHSYTEDPTF